MKTGPNRTTIGSDAFFLNEPRPAPLGKVGQVDFTTLPNAEKDICDEFVSFQSYLRSEQIAPDLKTLQDGIERLDKVIQGCAREIAGFMRTDDGGWERLEFNAALNDLLYDHGFRHVQMASAAEETVNNLNNLGMFVAATKQALATKVDQGEVVKVSSRRARDDYYRRLHAILGKHGLDDDVGETSLIVQLVMQLDGKLAQTVKSGAEASKEAELERGRRKELASNIKEAVNTPIGG